MNIEVKKLLIFLIVFGLIIVPFLSFSETYALMYLSSRNHSLLLTPWYIKILKDLIFISLITTGIIFTLTNKNITYLKPKWLILFFLLFLSISISFLQVDLMLIFSGLRWTFPIFALVFLIGRIDKEIQIKIAKILIFLILLGLIIQFFQTSSLTSYFGPNQFGFSKRNPGLFTNPSTMSILILLSMWYVYSYLPKSRFNKIFIFIISPISVFLAGSATGIIVLVLFYLSVFIPRIKQKKFIIILSIFSMILLIIFLPALMNRADLFISLYTRFFLFDHINFINLFIGDRFGLATNTGIIMGDISNNIDDAFAVDSLILSIIINTGLLSLIVFLFIVIKNIRYNMMKIRFFLIIIPFSFNSILFEVYPANLLISISLAYFLSYEHQDKVINQYENK